jgi:hypothetical protein
MAYITPEQFIANCGYSDILLYSERIDEEEDLVDIFDGAKFQDIIRAKENTLVPKQKAHSDIEVINSVPDKTIFFTDKVQIDGNIKIDLAATMENALEYPVARMFDHMRNSWIGLRIDENASPPTIVPISPREDFISALPVFSLASYNNGAFIQCMIDKFELNVSKADQPIELNFGMCSSYFDISQFQDIKNVIYRDILTNDPENTIYHTRRIVYGKNCSIRSTNTGVSGNFGLPDAKRSIFAKGPNKPADFSHIVNFTFSIENKLEPIYTMKSHEIEDPRKRFEENTFPHSYASNALRQVTGTIEWLGNADPLTFIERIVGPGTVQNRKTIIIDCECFQIEILNPVWSLSEKKIDMGNVTRIARFTATTDGTLLIPQYATNYKEVN